MNKNIKIITFIISTSIVLSSLCLMTYVFFNVQSLTEPEINAVLERGHSKVFDISNREIETLGENKKIYVEYKDIPPVLVDALISIEDKEFFHHDGINYKRIFSSLINNIFSDSTQGGSTITQQLVKNTLLTNEQNISRKIKEAYLSMKLEEKYSKEQILELYFNEIYFDGVIPGIGYAAKRFFGKEVKHLNLVESALLAGVLKSPTLYSPFLHIENAEERKNLVLNAMYENNLITEERLFIASNKKVKDIIVPKGATYKEKTYDYQAYLDIVYKEVEELTGHNPFSSNLEIYTYLDTSLQTYLDDIQKGKIYNFQDDYQQIASAILNNNDASIIGVIGGRNYEGMLLYNRAYDMKKQPASTLKPVFTYALAMEHLNYHEYSQVEDKPYTYPNSNITVHNADKKYLGTISLVDALGYSRNTSTLYTLEKVIKKIGMEKVVSYLNDIGIMDEGRFSLPYAIGGMTYGVNPISLAGSYRMLSKNGNYLKPSTIKLIKNKDTGEIIYKRDLSEKKVLSTESSYLISSALKKVMDGNYYKIGNAKPSNINVYAKTGTNSYDHNLIKQYGFPTYADADVWFAGYSKNYTIASWTGFDKPVKNTNTYFGRNDSRRLIVKDIFKECLKRLEIKNLLIEKPSTMKEVSIVKNAPGNYLPNDLIPTNHIVKATFKLDEAPTKVLPYPILNEVKDIEITQQDNELQLSVNHMLEDDLLYKNIFGKKVYLITYEDETTSNTFITSENTITLPFNQKSFTITICETFENNNKLTSTPYIYNYDVNIFY